MSGEPKSGKFGLYLHIPFCTKKCHYCHFYVIPNDLEKQQRLQQALLLDFERWKEKIPKISTVYFGGGTPALFALDHLKRLLEAFSSKIDPQAEITIEANPENLTEEELKTFAKIGFNRLSIGVQSFDEALLPSLGRTHTAKKAIESIEKAADYFDNLSIDLMYDLPGQSLASWEKSLQIAAGLPISHLSLYNLTVEPGTLFFKKKESLSFPSPSASAAMYNSAVETLEKNGFDQYEISAFARGGKQSRHNLGYWLFTPFLGIGPSAFSFIDGKRFRSHPHFTRYCESLEKGQSPIDYEEKAEGEKALRERLVIALRILKGVDLISFPSLPSSIQEEIQELISDQLLEKQGSLLKMTQKGIRFYDTIASTLI